MSKSVEERVKYLEKCAELYETGGNSPLTDDQYDAEKEACQKLMPDHPFFSSVGGIDIEAAKGFDRVTHRYIMGSLCKDPSPEEFGNWLEKTYGKDIDKLVALIQLKVDGCSFCLKYQDKKFVQGVSRGDGITGLDYSNNIRQVRGFKDTISSDGYVEIKGEIYKNLSEFKRDYEGKGFTSARNMASGTMALLDPMEIKKRNLDFVAYEVRGIEFKTETDKIKFLIDNGFNTLKDYTTKISCSGRKIEDITRAIKNYMDRVDRSKLPFLVDGIVFKNNNIPWSESLGTTDGGKRPKGMRAVKFPCEAKETTLIKVISQVGRTGVVKPVGIVDSVDLGGANCQKASLHNYGALIKNGAINIGSKVLLERRGDIIPQVTKVISLGNVNIDIPTNCPECNSILNWTENEKGEKVDLVCENINCIAQLNKKIDFWFKTIGVKDFGQKTIAKLTDKDILSWEGRQIISSLVEMYYLLDNDRASEHPFRKYQYLKDQLGEKTYENLLESIHSVKEIDLSTFIEALGIARIGSMSKDIVAIAPTIDKIDLLKVEEIQNISGFGPVKSQNFISEWATRRDEIRRLLKYVNIKQVVKASDKLAGLKFCFTGSFSQGRDELQKVVIDNGGKASSSVGKGVILVWDGSMTGGKHSKAVSEGNKIISEADFFKMLG